jgi:putative protease
VTRIPELLAPAGNLEKLETALLYGADAAYVGLEGFSLRAHAGKLSPQDLAVACELAHRHDRRLYLTLNAYLRPGEESVARDLLEELRPLPVDAYIVADPGMLALVREIDPERELHLSTQMNSTNALAANFWQSLGVKRLNLARELSLEEIRTIRAGTSIELEMFVHGAMCVAYSGRCLLSAALTDRSANRGNCSQPCRWQYSLQEEKRPGEFLPIEEDGRGTYLMNSHDLCLIEALPELVGSGVTSLKIEGRMKSRYYVAVVTRIYRAALDALRDDPDGYACDPFWLEELATVSHRPYSAGFLSGGNEAKVHAEDSAYRRTHDFVGVVLEGSSGQGTMVEGRNRFIVGEELELIGPAMRQERFQAGGVWSAKGEALEVVQPNAMVLMNLPASAQPGDLLRRCK